MQRQLGGALQQREVDRCALPSSSRASLPQCSAVAQRPRRGAVRTSTAYHHSLEEREPEASTSCPSLPSAADMGMRVNLARLERSFSSSRHGHGGRGSMDTSLFGPGTFLVTLEDKPQRTKNQEKTSDYFANLGDAIRTLRDDIPSLFERDLNCECRRSTACVCPAHARAHALIPWRCSRCSCCRQHLPGRYLVQGPSQQLPGPPALQRITTTFGYCAAAATWSHSRVLHLHAARRASRTTS